MSSGSKPRRIEPEFHSKIWGSPRIAPWFTPRADELTGEVWFPAGDLLIKFLFTSQDLSVQVHPDNLYAQTNEQSRGKTEMWHVLRADPGARIALGFRQPISADQLMSSARSGEIRDLLNWFEVHPEDTYFIPAGVVHAIGAGIALCEIQQNSDVTYRLYDYGRGRQLHLEHALHVADLGPHPGKSVPRDIGDGIQCLVECNFFRTFSATVNRPAKFAGELGCRYLIVLDGAGLVNGLPVSPGHVLQSDGSRQWRVEPDLVTSSGPLKLLLTE